MIIDNIKDVQDIIKEEISYTFAVDLVGSPANGRYPEIKIMIGNSQVWSGAVVDNTLLKFNCVDIAAPEVNFEIEYFNKLENDTVVDHNGTIVANQSVKINSVAINELLITGHQLLEHSSTNYFLTEGQKAAYTSNNFPWESVKTDTIWNNGVWQIKLQKPIIASLIKQKYVSRQVFELSHLDILNKLQNYFRE
jgi:hypothetical protein